MPNDHYMAKGLSAEQTESPSYNQFGQVMAPGGPESSAMDSNMGAYSPKMIPGFDLPPDVHQAGKLADRLDSQKFGGESQQRVKTAPIGKQRRRFTASHKVMP